MRVKWSGDAAQSILWQLREAEQSMNDCIREAASGRSALDEANPDAQSRTLNRLTAEFEEALGLLRGLAEDLGGLVRATETARDRFRDAEKSISDEIDRIATGTGAAAPDYCPPLPPVDMNEGPDSFFGWTVPVVELMPTMRLDGGIPAPDWFLRLLNNQEFFTTLMNR